MFKVSHLTIYLFHDYCNQLDNEEYYTRIDNNKEIYSHLRWFPQTRLIIH